MVLIYLAMLKISSWTQKIIFNDLSDSAIQPMSNEKKNILTFNGEIYNYKIKKNIETNSHEFKSNSDSEVIIHAYEEWNAVFKKLMECLLLQFGTKTLKTITCKRQIWIKPLYYF